MMATHYDTTFKVSLHILGLYTSFVMDFPFFALVSIEDVYEFEANIFRIHLMYDMGN